MHLLICVSVLLQTFDERQMTDNWTQSQAQAQNKNTRGLTKSYQVERKV